MGGRKRVLWILLIGVFSSFAASGRDRPQAFLAKYLIGGDGSKMLVFQGFTPRRIDRLRYGLKEIRYPQFFYKDADREMPVMVEVCGLDRGEVLDYLYTQGVSIPAENMAAASLLQQDEVVTLVDSGPVENRLDFVFLGDGYTLEEKSKFFADISRMVNEMFVQETFRSYLPLFNIHAVFRPSNVSGIGRGVPKDTAFRLYRDGDTLRAIFCADLPAARSATQSAPDCDVPVLIANDPYYGGLGGEFAISTCSINNGTLILGHELGHTLGLTGDEYDGGSLFGANYAPNLDEIPWASWLTAGGGVRAEPLRAVYVDWPWYKLSRGPFEIMFSSPGNYPFRLIRFSASGLGDPQDDMIIFFDGIRFPITGPLDDDRYFYDIFMSGTAVPGNHTLSFTEGYADGNNWLSSLTIHEYGADYHFEDGYIGAFPIFDADERFAGYRPVHDACLMRNIVYPRFCPVCRENLWHQILDRLSLIEGVDALLTDYRIRLEIKVPGLGQFRAPGTGIAGERLLTRWYRFGREQTDLANMFSWTRTVVEGRGKWRVEVELITPEVRSDPERILVHELEFDILASKGKKIFR